MEIVRRSYEAYNAQDTDALRDLYDPDVVMHHVEGWPEARARRWAARLSSGR